MMQTKKDTDVASYVDALATMDSETNKPFDLLLGMPRKAELNGNLSRTFVIPHVEQPAVILPSGKSKVLENSGSISTIEENTCVCK